MQPLEKKMDQQQDQLEQNEEMEQAQAVMNDVYRNGL